MSLHCDDLQVIEESKVAIPQLVKSELILSAAVSCEVRDVCVCACVFTCLRALADRCVPLWCVFLCVSVCVCVCMCVYYGKRKKKCKKCVCVFVCLLWKKVCVCVCGVVYL